MSHLSLGAFIAYEFSQYASGRRRRGETKMQFKLCMLLAVLCFAFFPLKANCESVSEFLRLFHKDPARTMNRLPSVISEDGTPIPQGYVDFDRTAASIPGRLETIHQITGLSIADIVAAVPDDQKDNVEKLLDPGTTVERNLSAMQSQGFTNITAALKPWADSYWPTYRGQIAYRYAAEGAPKSKSWGENFAYAESHPASLMIASGDVNLLSPAEKYDFVMGDTDFTLTHFAWSRGQKSFDDGEGVATWMGICHGWSGAAHMGAPFIAKPVTVIAQGGTPVTFYPQDIKALQSMLWANAAPTSRFVGARCNVPHPERNGNGRITDPACFDTNPATWHLAVVNQMGHNRRAFVFNAAFGEIWNFPLLNTRYRYFNPQTFEEGASWESAAVPIEKFKVDKFKEFRSHDTRSVVGISMDVTYPVEIEPGVNRVFDAPTKTVRYIYDLELDASRNVIGGEWYSIAHPTFLWTFDGSAQAMAFDENVLLNDVWGNDGHVPLQWTTYARKASARGAPLYAFLKKVIDAAGPVHQP
jgi:Transglutaminase elicitor